MNNIKKDLQKVAKSESEYEITCKKKLKKYLTIERYNYWKYDHWQIEI